MELRPLLGTQLLSSEQLRSLHLIELFQEGNHLLPEPAPLLFWNRNRLG
jgi:hypothetical protein